mmetsp:Transcript_16775/g.44386  ORF Transcript_16775/g.44386 Transcript_16775/m.44386 type:complete len:231 (-) Transcript_16775:766-1458(-)
MLALPSSTAASRASISSCSRVRVTLLLPISSSQNPSWSASSFASSSSRVIMPSMSFLTLAKGSVSILSASSTRDLLFSRPPSFRRNSRTRRRTPRPASAAEREAWTRATPPLAGSWANERCWPAAPATSGEDMISTAFPSASISSLRNFCFSWNDRSFSKHSAVMPFRVFLFASMTAPVAESCFLSSAAAFSFRCAWAVLSAMSRWAFSFASFRSSMMVLWACWEFSSSF